MNDQEKPVLIIEARQWFLYQGELTNAGGICWLYFLKTHIDRRWTDHQDHNKVRYDQRFQIKLIGNSRCGETLEQAKKRAYKIMAGRKYKAKDFDVEIRE